VGGGDLDSVASGIDELWQRRLVQKQGAAAYDFSHGLLRDVCYGELGPERCRSLHRRVAQVLVDTFGESDAASAMIAEHFERGGQPWEAVPHLERAAAVARHRYAERDAILFLERALGLLEQAAPGRDRDRASLRVLTSLGSALMRTRGYGAPEVGKALTRARALSGTFDEDPNRLAVLSASYLHHVVRADLQEARSIATACTKLGVDTGDAKIALAGRFMLAGALFHLGEMRLAEEHIRAVAAECETRVAGADVSYEFGAEMGVFSLVYLGHALSLLGDADGSQAASNRALARAVTLSHPFSLAVATAYDAMLQQFRGEPERTWRQADAASAICEKHGFLYYLSWMPILRGWARARSGAVAEGRAEMRDGYASFRATGAELRAPYYLALQASIALDAGDPGEAARLVGDGRATAARNGEHWHDAGLARLAELAEARGARR
jgi:predicted ATPase